MKFILDATALRSGMMLSGEFEWYTTSSVMAEIGKGRQAKDLDLLKDISINTVEPGQKYIAEIREAAEKTGDIGRLSIPDIEILALAMELDGTLLTDDYSIQNVAKVLNVEYRSGGQKGIKKIIHWTWRCKGCGRFFDEEPKGLECGICGSEVRTVRKK